MRGPPQLDGGISAQKTTLFCTRNAPNRHFPSVFLRFAPFFTRKPSQKKSLSGFPKGPVSPKKKPIFAPAQSLAAEDYSGFSVAERGVLPHHRKIAFLNRYNLALLT